MDCVDALSRGVNEGKPASFPLLPARRIFCVTQR
jgi:hypothetical protein